MRYTDSVPRLPSMIMLRRTVASAAVSTLALTILLVLTTSTARAAAPDRTGLVDTSTGIWRLPVDSGGFARFYYGNPGDIPFAGDWDCDGIDTPGLYRQSDGYVYLRNSNTQGPADITFFFGNPGDLPHPGDFDGDGCDTVSIYRPSESRVYIVNELGDGDRGLGAAEFSYVFGNPGDSPFTGDFDANGTDATGLYRESTGFTYLRVENTQGNADVEYFFGDPGDRFVAGDWDGDGDDTPGVFRPSDTTFYLKNTNTQGNADVSFSWGRSEWLPVAGAWGDLVANEFEVPELTFTFITGDLTAPVFLDAPPGDRRLFVVEKGGTIRVIENGTVLPTPFLTIGDISTGGEQGLLGMAFHPGFDVNGRFFVHHTDGGGDTRIAEYYADPTADVADPVAKATLLDFSHGNGRTNHNGGMIEFGPDGFLYVSLGDGGGTTDRSQDTNDLLGTILRIDVDKPEGANGAAGNPYIGGPGDDRIWAIGLRNPWRTAIDPVGGVLITADVGQDRREEVNVVSVATPGVNYGWPIMEGSLCYPSDPCSTGGLVLPEVEYTHDVGSSITGGYVYRGSAMPGFEGRYLYADFISGIIRSFEVSGVDAVDEIDHTADLGTLPSITSFGTDGQGEMYAMTIGGDLYRIDAAP